MGRRAVRKQRWKNWAKEGVEALNQMAGCGGHTCTSPASLSQRCAQEHVNHCYAKVGGPPPDLDREEALRALLAHCPTYAADASPVRPYTKDLVSWPPAGATPTPLEAVLPEADLKWFSEWKHHMLRSTEDVERVRRDASARRAYVDPALSGRAYSDFLWRLWEAGMVRWTAAAGRSGELGVFFVEKKEAASA